MDVLTAVGDVELSRRYFWSSAGGGIYPVDAGGRTRLYVGADGVKVRTVTQQEKDQRRREQATRRQQRGRDGLSNTRSLPPARPGSD